MKHLIELINSNNCSILELGCGSRKQRKDAIGIDILPAEGVDICGDVYEVLASIEDEVVEEVISHHFLEHVSDLSLLLKEADRILKPSGRFIATIPHFSNPYFYSDYTHKSFFGLYTFQYFCNKRYFRRAVPTYNVDLNFEIYEIRVLFGAERPFYIKYIVGKLLTKLINSNTFLKEYYETYLSRIIPCTELYVVLIKNEKK